MGCSQRAILSLRVISGEGRCAVAVSDGASARLSAWRATRWASDGLTPALRPSRLDGWSGPPGVESHGVKESARCLSNGALSNKASAAVEGLDGT